MRKHRDLLINLNLLFIAIIAGAVVLIIAWRVLEVVFPVLILLLAAMLLAFLLGPLVARLENLGITRVLAVISVYILLLAVIFGLGSLLVTPLVQQIVALTTNLPGDVNQLRHVVKSADQMLAARHIPIHLEDLQHQGLTYAQQTGKQVLGNTLTIVQTVAQGVIDIIAILVISLYLLIDGPRIRHNILRIIPDSQRNRVLFADAAVRTVAGGYVRGQLLLALTIGLMAAAGCFLLGVPYPLVIGLVAGFFELVPMLGPILGAVPAIALASFQGGWQLAAATIVLFIVIQQLEAHVIAPRIMGHAVGVHPIIAILAVLLGASLDGIFGALVAVPIAGIGYVVAQAVYSQVTGQQHLVTMVQRRPVYIRWIRRFRGRSGTTRVETEEGTVTVTVEAPSDQLASIVHERDVLAEQFEQAEKVAQDIAFELEPQSSTQRSDNG